MDLFSKLITVFTGVMIRIQEPLNKYRNLIWLTLGLIVGLIFAWGIWPVEWTNATPGHLRADFQDYYIARVAEDFIKTQDLDKAKELLGFTIEENPWIGKKTFQSSFERAAQAMPEAAPAIQLLQYALEADIAAQPPKKAGLSPLVIVLLLLVIVGVVAFLALRLLKPKAKPLPTKEEIIVEAPVTEVGAPLVLGEELTAFSRTYVLGDDYFDPSVSIERGPEFLGECGISFGETIGVGDPKKVTAFEVWLFDKADFPTVTAVLASQYAAQDPTLSAKLAARGEMAVAKPGTQVKLETANLYMVVQVREAEYAEGNLPPQSFFGKVTFDVKVWSKSAAAA